jgi:uncharacterized protein involved in exopolysaccharide biosynthesis
MRPYLGIARRYRWLLVAVVALVWGAGLLAAYSKYATTFESQAMIWVQRASPELTITSPDDPNLPVAQTAASQQAELLNQLLQTDSFVRDVIARASLDPAIRTPEGTRSIDGVRRNFRVRTLGTALLSVSFTANDPHTAAEMVKAALAVRGERVTRARVEATTAVGAFYEKDYELAQTNALNLRKKLDEFDASHKSALSEADLHVQAQLRLALDFAQVRLADLRGRMDRAQLAPALLEISGLEFQVIDAPREESQPTGGGRSAVTLAAVSIAAGGALAALLVVLLTLLSDHIAGPADVSRLAPATLFATVPRVGKAQGSAQAGRDLRTTLAAAAFENGHRDGDGAEDPQPSNDRGAATWR